MKQIAEALGVSTMTVSRAINKKENVDEKTRKIVLEKAKSMGYTPNHVAKSLVSQKTHTIGVVIPEIHHTFFSEVVSGIEAVVHETEYELFLTNSGEDANREKKVIEALRSKRVDGILLSCAENSVDFEYYKTLIKSGINIVFFDRCVENIGASCVSINDETSAFQITKHLIDHGYKKIAHLSGPKNLSIGQERFRGFKRALEEHKLPFRNDWIVESGFREDGGFNAMNTILDLPKSDWPRAVVAVNDPAAFGAMKSIKEHGLSIPDDVAIVGFSDDIRAELMPCPLTTVQQPAFVLGKKAAEKLIRLIEHDDEPVENIELVTKMMIRSSCGSHHNS
ncbi:MAG: LacI family DNA-binding transcriptional regulator [Bacteroidales bacterium]